MTTTVVSALKEEASCEVNWTIENWNEHQVVVAAGAGCLVEVGNPKVELRFFLCPKEKLVTTNSVTVLEKRYSLCAEVSTQVNDYAAIKVISNIFGDSHLLFTRNGTISLNKSKEKVVEVIDPFIFLEPTRFDQTYQNPTVNPTVTFQGYLLTEVRFSITAQLFRLSDSDKNVAQNKDLKVSAEAEESLAHDLKNMFVAHENYADLKLESNDHMTLDAHKFILSARSRYLQKTIDDAIKMDNFNGTMKMNINGKPLVVILHWMYTGELHENVGNVMEEVVDAAILFELNHLMKLLDSKFVTICNKENMFRLYQVAQKNGMPNAIENIRAYIQQNL